MKNSRRIAAGVVALVFLSVSWPVCAAEMDARQLKKDLKQADKQWKAGKVDSALELYEGILAGTGPGAKERANALYAVALASLSPDTARHDPERARTLLAELDGSFPRHPRRLEIQALAGLAEAQNATAEKARNLEQQLAAEHAALESQQLEASGANESLETQLEELRKKLQATERRLAANRAELKSAKEELAKKEEALEKLTERMVGRSGGK